MADQSFSSSFSELLATARGHFIWPDDATLYCLPPEHELLPDKIRRLSFQTYLQLCNLSYSTATAANADAMSPNGLAPFITVKIGSHQTIFSDFEKLVLFLETQNLGLNQELQLPHKADNAAFISVITQKLAPAEDYQTWIHRDNCSQQLSLVYGSDVAWPLNRLLPWLRRVQLIWNNWDMYRAKEDSVLLEFESACSALQARLGGRDTFFDSGPTCLDVLVFSHVQAILTTTLPSNELCRIVRQYQNLVQFCQTLIASNNLNY